MFVSHNVASLQSRQDWIDNKYGNILYFDKVENQKLSR